MSKSDWVRLWMHVPWGILAVGLFLYHPLLGATVCLGELAYEGFNDWRKKDSSYRDVIGIIWGELIGGYILLGLKVVT